MRIIRKIPTVEVKKAFFIAHSIKLSKGKNRRYLPKLEKSNFLKKIKEAKYKASKMKDSDLDKWIMNDWKKRSIAYNKVEWYLAQASINELGVWRRAGGLPPKWTCCSLADTAKHVKIGLTEDHKHIKARSKRAIPRIIEFSSIISKEKYLYPIVFKSGTGTRGRRWCNKVTKGDIDDGCMRSIALSLAGHKKLNIYFGR